MSDLATIGGVIVALSAVTSGVCAAVAYHVPARLRDGLSAVSALVQGDDGSSGDARHQHGAANKKVCDE